MQIPKLFCSLFLAIGAFAADPGVWKVAPPPPASWQRDRVKDLAARRKALMDQIGDHAVLVLYAAEPRNYSNDVDWPFRQENDFFYLTGLTQPGATLVLAPGAGKIREMVFIPRSNPAQETWTGHMITPAEVRETSGIAGRLRIQPVQRLSLHPGPSSPFRARHTHRRHGWRPRRTRRKGRRRAPGELAGLDHGVCQADRVRGKTGPPGLHDSAGAPQRRRVPP